MKEKMALAMKIKVMAKAIFYYMLNPGLKFRG